MSRVAGLAAIVLAVLASGPALAEGVKCRGPEIVTAPYQEQICLMGEGGYSACRWIERKHVVYAPGACAVTRTSERADPATRGQFPPYRRLAPKG